MSTSNISKSSLRRCQASKCEETIPHRMLMCRKHWAMVPFTIRAAIWRHYTPGQESKPEKISRDYVYCYKLAVNAVAEREDNPKPFPVTSGDGNPGYLKG